MTKLTVLPKILFVLIYLFLILSCRQEYTTTSPTPYDTDDSVFSNPIDLGIVDPTIIDEASGITRSVKNSGKLWTHNDSGGKPYLYLIDTTGQIVHTFHIENVNSRDWEDIAIGPGPVEGESYLYLADIGDNMSSYDTYIIYRIPEPIVESSSKSQDTIREVDAIEYVYPDNPKDAETIMVDPITSDIYIISKRDFHERIYRAAFPQQTDKIFTIEKTGEIPINIGGVFDQLVGGDISPDGMEILLKSYVNVFYWRRESTSTSITDLLTTSPVKLPYVVEPQGEAIGFSTDGNSYYTLSESQGGAAPHLYKYQRKRTN